MDDTQFYVDMRQAYWKQYDRRTGERFYRAALAQRGKSLRLLRKRFKRAQDAVDYGKGLLRRYEQLLAVHDEALAVGSEVVDGG